MNDKQKKLLGIGAISVVGVIVYHKLHGGGGRPVVNYGTPTSGATTGSITPYTPQAPIVVPAGESIYDPNSEGLLNTPAALAPQATTPAGPAYVVNVTTPRTHATTHNRRRAAKRRVTTRHNQNTIAKSKRHKPPAKKVTK